MQSAFQIQNENKTALDSVKDTVYDGNNVSDTAQNNEITDTEVNNDKNENNHKLVDGVTVLIMHRGNKSNVKEKGNLSKSEVKVKMPLDEQKIKEDSIKENISEIKRHVVPFKAIYLGPTADRNYANLQIKKNETDLMNQEYRAKIDGLNQEKDMKARDLHSLNNYLLKSGKTPEQLTALKREITRIPVFLKNSRNK